MWKKIKAIKGTTYQSLPSILKHNETLLSSPTDISDTFAQSFTKSSCDSNFDPYFIYSKQNPGNTVTNERNENFYHQKNYLNIPFNETELYNAISKCKSKSPGPDKIPYSFIQNLHNNGKIQLAKIYNAIWNNGIYPD